jgi:hypothetical protein
METLEDELDRIAAELQAAPAPAAPKIGAISPPAHKARSFLAWARHRLRWWLGYE